MVHVLPAVTVSEWIDPAAALELAPILGCADAEADDVISSSPAPVAAINAATAKKTNIAFFISASSCMCDGPPQRIPAQPSQTLV
jgi:hypothetical protein